jgi:hypothetical protein
MCASCCVIVCGGAAGECFVDKPRQRIYAAAVPTTLPVRECMRPSTYVSISTNSVLEEVMDAFFFWEIRIVGDITWVMGCQLS